MATASLSFRKYWRAALIGLTLVFSPGAFAALQTHTFTISGASGISGNGSITWDDAAHPTGSTLAFGNPNGWLTSLTITLQGGPLSSPQSFSLAQCTEAVLDATPTFSNDLNFWCDNGTASIHGEEVYFTVLTLPGSPDSDFDLTITPGTTRPAAQTVAAVPSLSSWPVAALAGLLALVAVRRRQS